MVDIYRHHAVGLDSPGEHVREFTDFSSDIILNADEMPIAGGVAGDFTLTSSNNAYTLTKGGTTYSYAPSAGTYTGETLAGLMTTGLSDADVSFTYNATDGIIMSIDNDVSLVDNEAEGWTALGFTIKTYSPPTPEGQVPRFIRAEPASSGTNLLVVELEEDITHHIDNAEILPVRPTAIKSTTTVARVQVFW